MSYTMVIVTAFTCLVSRYILYEFVGTQIGMLEFLRK